MARTTTTDVERQIPTAVRKYAESQGLPLDHPRIRKYAASMRGRMADDELIEEDGRAKPLYTEIPPINDNHAGQ